MALEKQKVGKYKAEVQDYGERLGKEVPKMIDCNITKNYFSEKARMTKKDKLGRCKLHCGECLLNNKNNGTSENLLCGAFEAIYPEKAISIIQKWSDKHPQRTYLSELLRTFPNAELNCNGTPKRIHCPHHLGLKDIDNCDKGCVECWNQPMPAEGGEE
jgi:hypothetical protein